MNNKNINNNNNNNSSRSSNNKQSLVRCLLFPRSIFVVQVLLVIQNLLSNCCIGGQQSSTSTSASESSSLCIDESYYSNNECYNWDTFMNNIQSPYENRIVIPCGVCVKISNVAAHPPEETSTTSQQSLTFLDGLDIQGKLWIDCYSPPELEYMGTTTINIQTTTLLVQGLLIVNSSCKAVDGNPFLTVHLISKDLIGTSTVYVPIHDSVKTSASCSTGFCDAGEKAITIAGGRVDIIGLPPDTPSWLNLYDVTYSPGVVNPTGIVVSSTVKGKWNPGATILITAFTTRWFKYQQVRTVTAVNDYGDIDSSLVELQLNASIVRPTTILDSPDYAVEVALLSKNILFTASVSGNNTIGGHFWFFNTPNVPQSIIGVDIQNFGQQGRLGRYPLHVHHCKNSSGILISKNTIRQSFQRCIVIHGSDNAQIHENVAYDTAGHCYVLEDGIEIGNYFMRNLGAHTRKPTYIIPPIPSAFNGNETDGSPSTFWITNTMNRFVGNVAAGSEGSGYWFELMKRGIYKDSFPDLDPKRNTLDLFMDNVAHSNVRGFRTYPSGYVPKITAQFTGIRAYRNVVFGLLFHISSNIQVEHSLFADNGIAIDINRNKSPAVRLLNVTIIGETVSFRTNVREKRLDDVCGPDSNIGVKANTRKSEVGLTASTWDRVAFSGFDHGSCKYISPITMDYLISDPTLMFDFYSTMNAQTFSDFNQYPIDFCIAERTGTLDIYLTDLDGSSRPGSLQFAVSPSTLVSLQTDMKKFIDPAKCTDIPSKCLSYCQDTCFRGVLFGVDPTLSTERFKLKICQKSNTLNCIFRLGSRHTEDPFAANRLRYFPVYVPVGEYVAVFVDDSESEVWPLFKTEILADSTCPNALLRSVSLNEPPVAYESCIELIRNGNAEASSFDPSFWLTQSMQGSVAGHMKLLPSAGVGGSNALSGLYNDRSTIFVQYVDTRCLKLMVNAVYRIQAEVKLIRNDGAVHQCSAINERCPEIGIATSKGSQFVATSAGRIRDDGYETVRGDVRITDKLLTSSWIKFYAQSYNHQLLVDNVSLKLINETNNQAPMSGTTPSPATSPVQDPLSCSNLIANSDMELGYEGYWSTGGAKGVRGLIDTTTPGHVSTTALKYNKTSGFKFGPEYSLGKEAMVRCLTSTTIGLKISAQVRLIGTITKIGVRCDLQTNCPMVTLQIFDTNNVAIVSSSTRSYQTSLWNKNGYNHFETLVDLPILPSSWQDVIGSVHIGFGNFSASRELIWDDFGIVPIYSY